MKNQNNNNSELTSAQNALLRLEKPTMYLTEWLSKNGYTIDGRGHFEQDKVNVPHSIVTNKMWTNYVDETADYKLLLRNAQMQRASISKFSLQDLRIAIEDYIQTVKASAKQIEIKELECVKEDLSPLKRFLVALTGKCRETDVAAMSHWIWMVKRKMRNESVVDHIMPILFGKQGSGKTMALRKITAPVETYRADLPIDKIADQAYAKALSEDHVVVYDEMQGIARTDVDGLKRQITLEFNTYRPLYTNNLEKVRQACSFIGATNRSVPDQIIDSTGMRRFWELKCADLANWEEINKIDYLQLWKGVDESKDRGYLYTQVKAISAEQELMTNKEDLDLFLEEADVLPIVVNEPIIEIDGQKLYETYKAWHEVNGYKQAYSKNVFGRRLSARGIQPITRNVSKAKIKRYQISSKSGYSERCVDGNVVSITQRLLGGTKNEF